jgi:Phosphoesterase family
MARLLPQPCRTMHPCRADPDEAHRKRTQCPVMQVTRDLAPPNSGPTRAPSRSRANWNGGVAYVRRSHPRWRCIPLTTSSPPCAPDRAESHPENQTHQAPATHPLDGQESVVELVNRLERLASWRSIAVVIMYDDSDGAHDHVVPPIVNQSQTVDSPRPSPACSTSGAASLRRRRCSSIPTPESRCTAARTDQARRLGSADKSLGRRVRCHA